MLAGLLRQLLSLRSPSRRRLRVERLHIGGTEPHPDWWIVNVQPGPHVRLVASCTDLSALENGCALEIYASHVLEHLGYQHDLPQALAEMRRVLQPGGLLKISVPDLDVLAGLYLDGETTVQERYHVMRMLFGGQVDKHDFHRVGLNFDILAGFLRQAGFEHIERVDGFGLFTDTSTLRFRGRLISLNMQARNPA